MDWRFARPDAEAAGAPNPKPLAQLLGNYSVEVTAGDGDEVGHRLERGTEVFVANLPKDGPELLIKAAAALARAGLRPLPHIAARKIRDRGELETLLERLAGEAGVEQVLVVGGDRDSPAGSFDASEQLIETGVFEKHGIRQVSIACYPEGHPRIAPLTLWAALETKLAAIAEKGMAARLVSQFAFRPEPILAFARRLRASGITAPLRIGVAGPAPRTTLIRYAMRCGVGASLRTLTGRKHLISGLLGSETPESLLETVAVACRDDPALAIEGVHFFTFGAPAKTIEWVESRLD